MREIYFDNSATTKQLNSVIRVMVHTAEKFYGNPSSLHSLGYETKGDKPADFFRLVELR